MFDSPTIKWKGVLVLNWLWWEQHMLFKDVSSTTQTPPYFSSESIVGIDPLVLMAALSHVLPWWIFFRIQSNVKDVDTYNDLRWSLPEGDCLRMDGCTVIQWYQQHTPWWIPGPLLRMPHAARCQDRRIAQEIYHAKQRAHGAVSWRAENNGSGTGVQLKMWMEHDETWKSPPWQGKVSQVSFWVSYGFMEQRKASVFACVLLIFLGPCPSLEAVSAAT